MTPTEWVVSMNLHRRHLTTAQRAALALDLLPRLEEEAKERMLRGKADPSPESDEGRADEKAAEIVGLKRTSVAHARAIQKRALRRKPSPSTFQEDHREPIFHPDC